MIAVITSCISPLEDVNGSKRSHISKELRIEQTLETIASLQRSDFEKIYLVDNSAVNCLDELEIGADNVIKLYTAQYQFYNKGINELLMLLYVLYYLPPDTEIFKISGRYVANENFINELPGGSDFKIRSYQFDTKHATISTRGYFVRNKKIYEEFLLKTLKEVFNYQLRVVGVRSFLHFIKSIYNPMHQAKMNTSIEFASAMVLKHSNYRLFHTETMGISGNIAGFENLPLVNE